MPTFTGVLEVVDVVWPELFVLLVAAVPQAVTSSAIAATAASCGMPSWGMPGLRMNGGTPMSAPDSRRNMRGDSGIRWTVRPGFRTVNTRFRNIPAALDEPETWS